METDKKTGLYGPALWDCSPVRSQKKLDWTVQSSLRPDHLVGVAFSGDLEHPSVTPKALLLVATRSNALGVTLLRSESPENANPNTEPWR